MHFHLIRSLLITVITIDRDERRARDLLIIKQHSGLMSRYQTWNLAIVC